MKLDNKYFRVEAVLEAPVWVLFVGIFLVTIAVVATSIQIAS